MQVHPATLPFNLIHLALAVVLKAGLERQQSGIPREHLKCAAQSPFKQEKPGARLAVADPKLG
jgi:hypothetical protein